MVVAAGAVAWVSAQARMAVGTGQRTATPGTAVIIGRVIDGMTGAAVSGAAVTIGGTSAPRAGSTVLVDSQGRFFFSALAPGVFTLSVQKNGYAAGAYGRTRPGGPSQSIELRDAERRTDVAIRIWRWASITGQVIDEAGEPLAGVNVMAFRRNWVAGRASLSATGSSRPSDDRGMFRIGRLSPGEHIVGMTSRVVTFPIEFVEADAAARQSGGAGERSSELTAKGASTLGTFPAFASARIGDFRIARSDGPDTPLPIGNDRLYIFPISFHPNAPSSELATPIALAAGEQRLGVDLQLRLTPTVKISGVVRGPNGPIENLGLRLQLGPDSQFFSRMLVEPAHAVSGAGGAFTFLGVPPGSFTIVASVSASDGSMFAALPVTVVDTDISDLGLVLRPTARVAGRIEFDGASERPQLRSLGQFLRLDPLDGHFERLTVQADATGTFSFANVPPGRYFVRQDPGSISSLLGAWTLRSVMLGGRDISDVPLTVAGDDIDGLLATFTDRTAILTGLVRDAQGAADATAAVVVFPADRGLWSDYGALPRRLRAATTDRTGAFSIPGLPSGEYFVLALPDENAIEWQRQTFLARASAAAARVKIEESRNATVQLVTRRW